MKPPFMRCLWRGLSVSAALMLAAAPDVFAECYMDTPSGYTNNLGGSGTLGPYGSRSECESVNSSYFYGNGTCTCQDSSSVESGGGMSTLGGSNMFDPLFQPIGEAMGQAVTNAMFGDPQQAAHEAALRQQRQQAEQLEQARRAEAERLAQEQHRREFAEAQDRMLSQVKGLDGAMLDGERPASTRLVVKEVDDIFGTRAVTPVAAGDTVEVAGLTLKTIDFNPSVPLVGPEIETPESEALRERVRQDILAHQALVDLGKRQLAEHQAAQALVNKAEQELATARRAAEEARNRKLALETSPPAVPTPPSDTSIQDALAALEKAEQATTEAERALAEARRAQETIERQMKETLQTLEPAPRPSGGQPDPALTTP